MARLLALHCKLLCHCFKYLLERNYFSQHQMSKRNVEVHLKHLKVLEKSNWRRNISCVCKYLYSTSLGNCSWCYSGRSLYLAFRQCQKDHNIHVYVICRSLCMYWEKLCPRSWVHCRRLLLFSLRYYFESNFCVEFQNWRTRVFDISGTNSGTVCRIRRADFTCAALSYVGKYHA